MNPITPVPSPVFPRSPNVPVIASQCSHWCGNPRPLPVSDCHSVVIANQSADWRGNPSPRPQARQPFFYMLPPAGYFCHQRQKYPKTPLETTFQDFLSALRPVSNLTHVPRAIGFSVYRCRSKGLCHHSFPLSLRCRCPLPRQPLPPLPPYRGTSIPTQPPSLELSFLASDRCHWRGNPFPQKPPPGLYILLRRNAPHLPFAVRCTAKGAI